jgi:hypothetical protein
VNPAIFKLITANEEETLLKINHTAYLFGISKHTRRSLWQSKQESLTVYISASING